MATKHARDIEKRSLYSQNLFCNFFLLLWCVDLPNRGECSVFSSVVRGNLENYSEPRRNFTLYAEKI